MQTIERCIKQIRGLCKECTFTNPEQKPGETKIYSLENSLCNKGYEPITYNIHD